jgi:glyoxylase-like metal-dependent hydrolase (beta-lactamase superfamily II)
MHRADSFIVENGVIAKRKIRTLMGKMIILMAKWQNRKVGFDKFKPDVYLEDGQNLEKYGFDGKIIYLPGHTKGSIGILTPEGDLFIGDTLANMRKPALSPFVDDFEELKKSLERLKGLNVKMVYPGHGKPFSGDNISKISM